MKAAVRMRRTEQPRITRREFVQGAAAAAGLMITPPALAQGQPGEPKREEPKGAADSKTLANLMTAYEGESNAHARYVEFAKKADQEGYGQVASLFRAAARAEEVHARNHADVIKKMGGAPKADIKKAEVKSTRENLEAALKGESYERDTMYPDFVKQARAEKNKDAMQTFNYALSAETEHAKFYQEALDHLDAWKAGKKEFYVCSVCGYTVTKIDFNKCPVCYSPKEKYEPIS